MAKATRDHSNEVICPPIVPNNPEIAQRFFGYWRIVDMPEFSREVLDEAGSAFIEFDHEGFGSFQFLFCRGELDCHFVDDAGKPRCDFSLVGMDERDDIAGRGTAIIESDGTMAGCFYLHRRDNFEFRAERAEKPEKKRSTRKKR